MEKAYKLINNKKYRLINKQTKEELLCDKVVIDGFDYYVSNEKRIVGDYYIGKGFNEDNVFKWDSSQENQYPNQNGKVVATNNPNIDASKVVDEVDELASLKYPNENPKNIELTSDVNLRRVCFKTGYSKSQETHPNSDEDMFDFYRWLNKNDWQDYSDIKQGLFVNFYGVQKQDKELLQLWKEQQPIKIYYE